MVEEEPTAERRSAYAVLFITNEGKQRTCSLKCRSVFIFAHVIWIIHSTASHVTMSACPYRDYTCFYMMWSKCNSAFDCFDPRKTAALLNQTNFCTHRPSGNWVIMAVGYGVQNLKWLKMMYKDLINGKLWECELSMASITGFPQLSWSTWTKASWWMLAAANLKWKWLQSVGIHLDLHWASLLNVQPH